jgi:hypothetical protein
MVELSKANHLKCGTIKRLPLAEGFACNMIPAREDRLARRAAMFAFGKQKTPKILKTLHRCTLTYEALYEDLMHYD